MRYRLLPLLTILLLPTGALQGQAPGLDRVEALLAAGDAPAARSALDAWWRDHGDDARDALRPRALLLRARLAADPEAAHGDYLAVTLEHPLSQEAPEALLRLGQSHLASGDTERASRYLARLAADYPSSPAAEPGRLWLARARRASGDAAGACAIVQAASGADSELDELIRAERAAACARPNTAAAPSATATPGPSGTRPAPVGSAAPAAGRFAVQAGAFRVPDGARSVAARLRKLGYEPRIVRVDGTLLRVRVGRYASQAEAEQAVRALAQAGLQALVVGDVAREEPVQLPR